QSTKLPLRSPAERHLYRVFLASDSCPVGRGNSQPHRRTDWYRSQKRLAELPSAPVCRSAPVPRLIVRYGAASAPRDRSARLLAAACRGGRARGPSRTVRLRCHRRGRGDASGSGAIPRLSSRSSALLRPRRLVGGSEWQPPPCLRCVSDRGACDLLPCTENV